MMFLSSEPATSCSKTVTEPDHCSGRDNGLYVMKIKVAKDIFIFPEIHCEDSGLTILSRDQSKNSSFRDKKEFLFNYNQIGMFY